MPAQAPGPCSACSNQLDTPLFLLLDHRHHSPLAPMQLDAIEGTRWIHWIVFNKDGLYKSESAELVLDGAPAIEKPPTLLDTVIGQVTTWSGQDFLRAWC